MSDYIPGGLGVRYDESAAHTYKVLAVRHRITMRGGFQWVEVDTLPTPPDGITVYPSVEIECDDDGEMSAIIVRFGGGREDARYERDEIYSYEARSTLLRGDGTVIEQ